MYLETFYDPELTLPKIQAVEEIERMEIDRIMHAMAITLVAVSTPRRLGEDASDEELALDKVRGRRASWALRQSCLAWIRKVPTVKLDAELRRRGTQLDWGYFGAEHQTELMTHLRLVSTWSIQVKQERWGRSAVVKLTNEMKWMQYALRD